MILIAGMPGSIATNEPPSPTPPLPNSPNTPGNYYSNTYNNMSASPSPNPTPSNPTLEKFVRHNSNTFHNNVQMAGLQLEQAANDIKRLKNNKIVIGGMLSREEKRIVDTMGFLTPDNRTPTTNNSTPNTVNIRGQGQGLGLGLGSGLGRGGGSGSGSGGHRGKRDSVVIKEWLGFDKADRLENRLAVNKRPTQLQLYQQGIVPSGIHFFVIFIFIFIFMHV